MCWLSFSVSLYFFFTFQVKEVCKYANYTNLNGGIPKTTNKVETSCSDESVTRTECACACNNAQTESQSAHYSLHLRPVNVGRDDN